MLMVPFAFVFLHAPGAFFGVLNYASEKGASGTFNLHPFGAALTVGIALITQMGKQADYLRFMPVQTIAADYRPDVIFMDLAMAGIDSCETLRRLRKSGHAGIHLVVVSANAFDKGQDNDMPAPRVLPDACQLA